MGYSILTPFANKQDQQCMLQFLQQHYRNEIKVLQYQDISGLSSPTDKPNYDSEKEPLCVGFDYKTWAAAGRAYAFRVCSWMAVHGGKQKRFSKHTLPYIIYDGHEDIAITSQPVQIKQDHSLVDEIGFYPLKEYELAPANIPHADNLIRNELKRLTQLWRRK